MEKGSLIPPLSSEYSRMTKKYRELLSLADNQVLAKVWVFNDKNQKVSFTEQERDRFRLLLELENDPNSLHYTTGVVATSSEQIEELSLEQLLTLYILNEITKGDFAQGYDYEALRVEIDDIKTMSIKDNIQNIESLKDWHTVLATIITFKEKSVLLNKIKTQNNSL